MRILSRFCFAARSSQLSRHARLVWLASYVSVNTFSRVRSRCFRTCRLHFSATCVRFARLYIAYITYGLRHARQACHSLDPMLGSRHREQKLVADQAKRIERLLREYQRNTE